MTYFDNGPARPASLWLLSVAAALAQAAPGRALDDPRPPAAREASEHADYDPLRADGETESLLIDAHDETRARTVPLRVYLPASEEAAPVLLFSHGLGGSRDGCAYLGRHWSARGYAAVFLQHPGSDEDVWRDAALGKRRATLERAATFQNLVLRCDDVSFVIDALHGWNEEPEHALAGRLDLERIGMSGHSFGARTTQSKAGQSSPLGTPSADERIDAALAMSPSAPRFGDKAAAFADVRVPWMLMTGTMDGSPIGDQSPASRREVYPLLPESIDKYELVLDGARHSAFSDRPGRGGDARSGTDRRGGHHDAILALSTAFWDAYLRDDEAARAWLAGAADSEALSERDVWQVHRATATGGDTR